MLPIGSKNHHLLDCVIPVLGQYCILQLSWKSCFGSAFFQGLWPGLLSYFDSYLTGFSNLRFKLCLLVLTHAVWAMRLRLKLHRTNSLHCSLRFSDLHALLVCTRKLGAAYVCTSSSCITRPQFPGPSAIRLLTLVCQALASEGRSAFFFQSLNFHTSKNDL